MIFTIPSVKRDRAGEPDGGGSNIDPGAPHFHSMGNEPEEPAKPGKSDTDKRQIESDLKAARAEAAEARENAKYWADRAKKGAAAVVAEPEPEPEPARREPPKKARDGETAEQFLDDLSKTGLKALLDRGTITDEQFFAELDRRDAALEDRLTKKIEAAGAGVEFDQRMGREFPELVADNKLVDEGKQPKSEIFKRTAQHFRQMVEDAGVKPDSAAARGLMYAAAKLAKEQIAMEGQSTHRPNEDREDGEDRRRRRIDAQAGERGASGGGDDDGAPSLTVTQRNVIERLKNFGVNEKEFLKHQDGARNGR